MAEIEYGCRRLIVGCGNPQRKDDGIGPYIVERLAEILGDRREIRFLTCHQLGPELLDAFKVADCVIVIDAAAEPIEDGWGLTEIEPDLETFSFTTHFIHPAFLLALTDSMYGKRLKMWVLSIQGDDFGFGEKLTAIALERAEEVISRVSSSVCGGYRNGVSDDSAAELQAALDIGTAP